MEEINVKELRTLLGITQRDLANKLDVEPVTVSRWERGDRKPHRGSVKKMLRLQRRAG